MRNTGRKLVIAFMAVGLFTGLSVAPAAAVADDGLLDDDGIDVGGDEGVSVGVDDGVEVGVGGDEGVNVGVGTEDGVNASVAGDEGVQVGAGPNDGLETSVAGQDLTEGAPTDVASGVDGIGGDEAPALGNSPLPGGDSLPAPSGNGINLTQATGVEVCDLTRLDSSKLPADALPGLDALPSELAPPGVPTNLLTTETVLGLATGPVPGTCEAVDLNDPQLDPTDPPTEPDGGFEIIRMQQTGTGGVLWISTAGTLNESGDGPSFGSSPQAQVEPDNLVLEPDFVFNAGEGDYGIDPVVQRTGDDVRLRGVVLFVGKNAGVDTQCTDLREYDGDLSADNIADLGPCEYELVGIPSLFTPQDLVQILGSAGEGGLPVDPGGQLPIDDLLSL